VYQANGLNAFTVPLPDGTIRTLAELPQMSPAQAHAWMDSSGLCKVGGIDVPIIFTAQLPQRSTAAPIQGQVAPAVAQVVAESPSGGGPLLWGGLGLAAVGAIALAAWGWRSGAMAQVVAATRGGDRSPIVTPPPAGDDPTAATDSTAQAQQAVGNDLIDHLWG
jgi:hypothetical protein